MKSEATILIVTHNSLPFLKATINSIRKAQTNVNYEILVVDNGSTRETGDYLKNEGIGFIRNNKNMGYIEAQGQAFQKIGTPYLCSCNDDILVTDFWLDKLLTKLRGNKNIKIAAPVKWGSRTTYPSDKNLSSREAWEQVKNEWGGDVDPFGMARKFTKGKTLEEFGEDFRVTNKLKDAIIESPPDFIAGFCFLTETSIWKKLGGFVDPNMKAYGTEDIERCWRLGIVGYKIIRTSDVYVHHFEGASVNRNNIDTSRMLVRNNRVILKKYGKFLWSWLGSQLRDKSMEEIVREYWVVGKLLKNSPNGAIPDKIGKVWRKYAKNNS